MVGAVGIEPTTFGLKGRCSTTELRPWRAGSQHLACSAERHGRRRVGFRRLLILTCAQKTSNRHTRRTLFVFPAKGRRI